MTRLIVVRHCESENLGMAGALPNARLTPRGHDQAELLAGLLQDEPIAAVCSSDSVRARQTAQHLTRQNIFELPDLAEVHLGSVEGATDTATLARSAEVLRSWVVDGDWSTAVADGESGVEVKRRMVSALQMIAASHPDQTVVIVGHVASLTAALAALCDGLEVWGCPLPHGVPFIVETDGRKWRCDNWPSTTEKE